MIKARMLMINNSPKYTIIYSKDYFNTIIKTKYIINTYAQKVLY